MSSGFIHDVTSARFPPFFKAESYSVVWIDHIFLIHLSTDGCLGCFYIVATVNNIDVQVCAFLKIKTFWFFHPSDPRGVRVRAHGW